MWRIFSARRTQIVHLVLHSSNPPGVTSLESQNQQLYTLQYRENHITVKKDLMLDGTMSQQDLMLDFNFIHIYIFGSESASVLFV